MNNTPFWEGRSTIPGQNKYRTHKVINEMNLARATDAGDMSPNSEVRSNGVETVNTTGAPLGLLGSSNNSIPNSNGNVNAQQKNTTSRTMAEDTGFGGNSVETVAELESKVRGYNESITQKSDLPTEIKNEFLNNPQMYEVLSNTDTLENANQILVEQYTILGGSFNHYL